MKKCLVLDLDNTIWGGVAGEDGFENIVLSLTPPGNGFMAFQQAILDHYHRGVILAINSRNNPNDAWEIIRKHPNMVLKENHFSAVRLNWNDKAKNMEEISAELNIGLDSMVFLDDDPTNRALVRSILPEVMTPDLPVDPSQYARFLNSLGLFEKTIITDEDKMRGNFYVTERLRREHEKNFAGREEFLKSLSLELSVYEDDDSCVSRLAQLTEKTNQFNIHKQPLTETEIKMFIESPKHKVFHAGLTDKFGDYGIIAFALIDIKEKSWHMTSLLMSCRVFGREVEEAFFGEILKRARISGAEKMTVSFKETEKNVPAGEFVVKHFYKDDLMISEEPYIPKWINIRNEDI